MKIWYQSYTAMGYDPSWKQYEDDLKDYARKVARPDTVVAVHGVEKMIQKMVDSDYMQYLHVSQVIEKALQAEREGYDAFCIGGTLDLGHNYLREVLDIPVAFIAESSFYNALLLARKFGIIGMNERILHRQMDLVRFHGLEGRSVPGVSLGHTLPEIIQLSEKDPQKVIEMFKTASRELISRGAGAIIPGFGAMSAFFGRHNVHEVDGIPIVDIVAVVIKTTEMLVDMKKLGVQRARAGSYTYVSKQDLMSARKFYGAEQ